MKRIMGQQLDTDQPSSNIEQSNKEQIKFLDLVQCDPDVYNELQKQKQNEFKEKHGEKELNKILWADRHHDFKTHRSMNYSLTEAQLETLKTNGIVFTQSEFSFPQAYLALYNNDMPVFITSDSMLFALHKFYDTWLKNTEETILIQKLTDLCKSLLDELYTITPTEQNITYLQQLELFFMVPFVIMSLNNELQETISDQAVLLYTVDEIGKMLKEEVIGQSLGRIDWKKLRVFTEFIGIEDDWSAQKTIQKHPKLFDTFQQFKLPDVNQPIDLKFCDRVLFDEMIKCIATNQDIKLQLGDVTIKLMGSLLSQEVTILHLYN